MIGNHVYGEHRIRGSNPLLSAIYKAEQTSRCLVFIGCLPVFFKTLVARFQFFGFCHNIIISCNVVSALVPTSKNADTLSIFLVLFQQYGDFLIYLNFFSDRYKFSYQLFLLSFPVISITDYHKLFLCSAYSSIYYL